jgi:thiamine biosynthesis lipoprotein
MWYQSIFKQINQTQTIFYAWFNAMHTRIDIALCNLSEEKSKNLLDEIVPEVSRIEKMTNRFDNESELSKLNLIAAIEPVYTTPELVNILHRCKEYNELTLGAFDITINSGNYKYGCINHLKIDTVANTIFYNHPDLQIDLNGFIKGYTLDNVRNIIKKNDCYNALINFGNSSVCGIGNHPGGEGWKINLPNSANDFVILKDECLTTSGNTSKYQHIKNPETGEYCNSNETISVITENATSGEVLSTALCVSETKLHKMLCEKLQGRSLNLVC